MHAIESLLVQEDKLNIICFFFYLWVGWFVWGFFLFASYQPTLFGAAQDDDQVLKKAGGV